MKFEHTELLSLHIGQFCRKKMHFSGYLLSDFYEQKQKKITISNVCLGGCMIIPRTKINDFKKKFLHSGHSSGWGPSIQKNFKKR